MIGCYDCAGGAPRYEFGRADGGFWQQSCGVVRDVLLIRAGLPAPGAQRCPNPPIAGHNAIRRYRVRVSEGQSVTKHILVIDDRANLLALLRMILEDERYQVSVLQEGSGAVEHVRENAPDLVILDLKLADASGLDILESLRAQEATADIPVIVYTAAVMEAEAVERLITSNPERFNNVSVLQKPFELDALLDRVGQLLGAREVS